jgi:site-specific recombinase XerC
MSMETGDDARCAAGDEVGTALLAEFRAWLDQERGLSPVSVRCCSKQAKAFLVGIGGPGAVSGLDAGRVTAFVVDHARDRNTWSAKAMVTSLRAFLRFAHATGRTGVPLAGAVPGVASWRLSALPRGLQASEIERLLAGCERETAVGLRDYSVLSLWPGSACGAPRLLACSSATSTGGPARSRSRARAVGWSGSRCQPRPGRRLPPG